MGYKIPITIIIGLFVAIFFIISMFLVGVPFAKTLFPSDDLNRLENSIDYLQETINDLEFV